EPGEHIGLLLPNASVTAIAFFGLHVFGRVPAMLNYTVGVNGLVSACRTARIRTVYTSRRFVDAAKLKDAVARLETEARIVYMEDLRAEVGLGDKILGLVFPWVAGLVRRPLNRGIG